MGILCCLENIQPPIKTHNNQIKLKEIIDFMYENLSNRVFATFCCRKSTGSYKINLDIETKDASSGQSILTSLSDLLVERAYVKCNSDGEKKIAKSNVNQSGSKNEVEESLKTRDTDIGITKSSYDELAFDSSQKSFFITVTHIETISEFYIRLENSRETDELRPLMEKIQYFYEKKVYLEQPEFQVNTPCVYFDDEKMTWYRGLITLIVDANHCIVRLVDIGKSKYANRVALRKIYSRFMDLPCQVARASLDMSFEEDKFDEVLNNKFTAIALNRSFLAKICTVSSSSDEFTNYLVNLFDQNGESVFMLLIQDHVPTTASALEESIQTIYNTTTMCDDTTIFNESATSISAESVAISKPVPVLKCPKTYPFLPLDMDKVAAFCQTQISLPTKSSQKFIDQDPTSPFPVHSENINKEQVKI